MLNVSKRTLGVKQLSLMEKLEAEGTQTLSINEARQFFNISLKSTYKIVQSLAHKGFLRNIGRGLYAVQPLSWQGYGADNVAATLAAAAHNRKIPFYIGFDTAAGYYHWFPEAYGAVTVAVPNDGRYTFPGAKITPIRQVRVKSDKFGNNIDLVTWHNVSNLPISTKERTIVDVISKPNLIGGYSQLLATLERGGNDPIVDQHIVAKLAMQSGSLRLQKRVGFLCELANWNWDQESLKLLKSNWKIGNRPVLDNYRKKTNETMTWNNKWQLHINVSKSQLIAEAGIR